MACDYVFEVTFFAAIMVYAAKYERPHHEATVVDPTVSLDNHKLTSTDELRLKVTAVLHQLIRNYCQLVRSTYSLIFTLIALILFWIFILWGTATIAPKLDGQKLLPAVGRY